MSYSIKPFLLSATIILSATAATADQGFYYGGGLSFSRANSDDSFGAESSETGPALGLTGTSVNSRFRLLRGGVDGFSPVPPDCFGS